MLKNAKSIVILVPDNSETGKLNDLIRNLTVASIEIGFISILPSCKSVDFTITYSPSDIDTLKKIVESTLDQDWESCTRSTN